MKTLLCIHDSELFFGHQHFTDPQKFAGTNIETEVTVIDEFTPTELTAVEEKYRDVDGILLHRQANVVGFVESDAFPGIPLFVAGHNVRHDNLGRKRWERIVDADRGIYLFTGSVRAARSFFVPDRSNLSIFVTPIMGRSVDDLGGISDSDVQRSNQYDIGFFSTLSWKKRPHRALHTAHEVATDLGRELRVWISGGLRDGPYTDLIGKLTESAIYDTLDITYEPDMPTEKLFERVARTDVMYMPMVKPTETTCYAAWETISCGGAVVGADWAGVGEAIKQSPHPLSKAIPIVTADSPKNVLPEAVRDEYPDLTQRVLKDEDRSSLMIDTALAQTVLKDALTTDTDHQREVHIPDQVHVDSTINAFEDLMDGRFDFIPTDPEQPVDGIPSDLVETKRDDLIKSTRGCTILVDPEHHNQTLYQESGYYPPK